MSFLSSLFGSKPVVPDLPQLNLGEEAGKAITANQTNLPAAESLVSSANLFSRDQIDQMLKAAIPGMTGMESSISGNIEAELKGQLPSDVKTAVTNAAAAKALSGGTSGSEFGRNIVARDLGLTSLDLTEKGLSSAESWMKTVSSIYEPSMMSVSSMFISPAQEASFDTQERNAQFQRQYLQNQISAMPDPVTVGLWNTGWSVVDAVLSAYTGSDVELGQINPKGSFSGMGGGGMAMDNGSGADYGGEMGLGNFG